MDGMIWLISFALFKACLSLSWTSTISNNTIVYACINDTVVFPWNFSKGDNEELVATKWFFNAPGQERRLLSIETENQFIRSPGVDNRLQFLPNAGISISNVSQSEFGIYSVLVVMKLLKSEISEYSQTAMASLPDPPISNQGLLQITLLSNAAFQPSTGQFHLEFTFGKFLDFGRPPVTAKWTTPSNTTLPTSRFDNDSFILTVPNPIEEGVYFSQLEIPDVLARCSVVIPLLKELYNTSVRATDARLTILETVQRSQQALLQLQEAELRQLRGSFHNEWNKPRSCADVRKYDQMNGIHKLYLPGNKTVQAYCDQTTDNGGWTVIQRRKDGSVDFNRNWIEYENGFGDLQADHWLGLSSINLLTKSGDYSLRVDLTDYSDNTFYALYSEFSVGSSSDTYRLTVSGYSGTAGDALANNNNFEFLTFDRVNKFLRKFSVNCKRGGWWLHGSPNINSCGYGALNGPFRSTNTESEDSIVWYSGYLNSWRQYKPFKRAEMKVRPKG